jgi:hypothetical protein
VLQISIALKKAIASAGFEPETLGSSGKHTKYYTTEATVVTRNTVTDIFAHLVISDLGPDVAHGPPAELRV